MRIFGELCGKKLVSIRKYPKLAVWLNQKKSRGGIREIFPDFITFSQFFC